MMHRPTAIRSVIMIPPHGCPVGYYLINASRMTRDCMHVLALQLAQLSMCSHHYQMNYNLFNEPFADSGSMPLFLDMHGLIFETSV